MPELILPAAVGDQVGYGGGYFTVRAKCEASLGHWVCITHPNDRAMLRFPTQLQKDIHVGDGKGHRLAWYCHEHGLLEVP